MMSAIGTLTAREWARLMGAALLAAVTIVALVAVVLPAAALAMAAALLLMATVAMAQRASAVARAARERAASPRGAAEEAPLPTLRLELPDGQVLAARPVPLAGESEHALLLTRDGYVVVSADGRVLYRL